MSVTATEKRKILADNIHVCEQRLYDATLRMRVMESCGKADGLEKATKARDDVERELNAYKQILAELPDEQATEAA